MPKQTQGLFKKPNSSYWYADFTDASGRRVKRSTRTVDRKEADAMLSKWKLEAHRQTMWNEEPQRLYDDLMLRYLQGPSMDKRAHDRDLYAAKRLTPFFQGQSLNGLGPADIQKYIDQRRQEGVGPATINKEINLLSAALNYGRRRLQWDVQNPVEGMRLRPPQGRIRWIDRSTAATLSKEAASVRGYLPDFIQLGLHTGMRKGEMLGLTWSRVDFERSMVYLTDMDQKNGKHGSIPLNAEAVAALERRRTHREQYCPQCPWVFASRHGERIANIRKGFESACEKAGITDFHPHDLRHTCAAWLVQDGVDIRVVCELLRHTSIQVTMRYAHLSSKNVRDAVERLSHFRPTCTEEAKRPAEASL
ncbi:site-specific integrase [uncultured Thiocystis sp.]|jgi:integrase|uniref:tyrosine-type recombinase/integrase n=1 Tax=uncultured Thiocystis sp. TaxID=1202134 RepID=UPI0025D83425|nr:site-specific integrase [uncultured Thiocystis sp.]